MHREWIPLHPAAYFTVAAEMSHHLCSQAGCISASEISIFRFFYKHLKPGDVLNMSDGCYMSIIYTFLPQTAAQTCIISCFYTNMFMYVPQQLEACYSQMQFVNLRTAGEI